MLASGTTLSGLRMISQHNFVEAADWAYHKTDGFGADITKIAQNCGNSSFVMHPGETE